MNQKQVRKLRKSMKGKWRETEYKSVTHRHKRPIGFLNLPKIGEEISEDFEPVPVFPHTVHLTPGCGRFIYQTLKQAYKGRHNVQI